MNHLAEQVMALTFLLAVLGFAVGVGVRRLRRPTAMAGKIDASLFGETDLLVLGGLVVLYAWLSFSSLAQPTDAELTSEGIVVSLFFHLITSLLVIVLIRRRRSVAAWWNQRTLSVSRAGWFALGSVGAMYLLMLSLKGFGYHAWMDRLGGDLQETVTALSSSEDPTLLAMLAFVAVVSAPLSEEILFRGYVHGVAKRFTGPWVAGCCSALLFAAAHANLQALLPLFIFGCLLAWLYEKTGNLWVPIASHACFNLTAVVISLNERSESLFPR